MNKAEKTAAKRIKKAAKLKYHIRRRTESEGEFFTGWCERTYDFKKLEREALRG